MWFIGLNTVVHHGPSTIGINTLYRGKSRLSLPPEIDVALNRAVRLVTKVWTGMKLDADRQQRVTDRQREFALQSQRRKYMSVKDAAYRVMEQSYRETAGRLNVATARQIMYVARPLIIQLTGKTRPWKQSSRFTQHLLPDFIAEYPTLTADWDVVWDDRGHFTEPHTKHQIGIGGIAVRRYIHSWDHQISPVIPWLRIPHAVETSGPANRFRYVLFIEKEGFMLHLDAARLGMARHLARTQPLHYFTKGTDDPGCSDGFAALLPIKAVITSFILPTHPAHGHRGWGGSCTWGAQMHQCAPTPPPWRNHNDEGGASGGVGA